MRDLWKCPWSFTPETFRKRVQVLRVTLQVVQLFESWAHHLSPSQFEEFGKPYAEQVLQGVKRLHPDTPVIYHANGGTAPPPPTLVAVCFVTLYCPLQTNPSTKLVGLPSNVPVAVPILQTLRRLAAQFFAGETFSDFICGWPGGGGEEVGDEGSFATKGAYRMGNACM